MNWRRSEIARDMVHVICDAHFEALRINGEPLVRLSNEWQGSCHVLISLTSRTRKFDWSDPFCSRYPVGLRISSLRRKFELTSRSSEIFLGG